MTLFDWYSAGYSPMMLGFCEVLVVSYVYGKLFLFPLNMQCILKLQYQNYTVLSVFTILLSFYWNKRTKSLSIDRFEQFCECYKYFVECFGKNDLIMNFQWTLI